MGGIATPNSGAGYFKKGDIQIADAGLLVECKTCVSPKNSFSIKKEWLEKNKQELFASGLSNSIVAFNFYYEDKNDYYVIDETVPAFTLNESTTIGPSGGLLQALSIFNALTNNFDITKFKFLLFKS